MHDDGQGDDLIGRLREGAARNGAVDGEVGSFDVVRRAIEVRDDPEAGLDVTLGGYIEKHDRPPAFTGSDEQPYTVAVDVERQGEDGADDAWAAFLLFIRWAATGAGIMSHIESEDVARAASEEDARAAALELSLFEVKAALDAAIARHRAMMED